MMSNRGRLRADPGPGRFVSRHDAPEPSHQLALDRQHTKLCRSSAAQLQPETGRGNSDKHHALRASRHSRAPSRGAGALRARRRPRGPPTGRSRTGPQRETGSAPPPGSSRWQAVARPAPRRPLFTWRPASSGWPGRSASCARRSSRRRRRQQRGRRPKACRSRSAGRGRALLHWASPPRRGRPRPSASPETQHGLIFRSRSSLGHSRLKAAVTSTRSHLRGQGLRRTLPRVRVRAGEPSQSSHDPPHRATASRSTRSRTGSFRPLGGAT